MSEDTAAAGDEEKSRDFIWQSGDTHAETNVNSSRHAARVAPEILHRTEAPRAILQGCGERMCGAMEADPFEQPYWNLDQYLIWLASRDPAAVLRATDHPNSGANPPIGWRVHRESNFDRQKVEMEAVRAIQSWPARQVGIGKSGAIKAHVRLNRKWVIDFEDEPPFAALLMATTKHGRQKKVRPQFNPQSIVQLYRAPTLSNVCYRLDDSGVGRFIAYSDVWNWRAECISLQETLPIDEAGSRAENTIRDICMNTPEKLTMLGFYKGDPELKPITPQAMAGLSINPLRGQLKTDLKAVGYRREYGAATKGDEDGPVIWTGLCFDRKQLVEAFAPTQPADGRGAPQKVDWSAIKEAFRREVAARGMPDKTNVKGWQRQADVERWIDNKLIEKGMESVSESTLRIYARKFLSCARKG